MGNLAQRIDKMFDKGSKIMAVAGILYVGSLATTYAVIENRQTTVNRHNLDSAQVDFSNFYNPIRFWQDNTDLIQEGNQLRREYQKTLPKYGSFPTVG